MDDRQAAKAFRLRQEEVRVGARALVRRLKDLEARGERVRRSIDKVCAGLLPACPLTDAQLDLLDEVEALDEDTRACRWQQYVLTADAIGADYTAADIASWCDRAKEMGARRPHLDYQLLDDLLHVRKVPNLPFRERVEARMLNNRNLVYGGAVHFVAARHGRHIDGSEAYDAFPSSEMTTSASAPIESPAESVGNRNNTLPFASLVASVHRHLCDVEKETGVNAGSASLIHNAHPQPRILKRWLGIETQPHPTWGPSLRLFVSYEQALALQRALDLSPHAAGV